ncbi:hypothetical protein BANRA_01910 [Escherichia coli]|nr:hypothetical protein BANRA_01910 [Escherichia coli]
MLAISSNLSKMIIFIFAIIIIVVLCVITYLYLYKDESLVSKHYINYMAIPENDGVLHGSQIFSARSGGYINIHKCRR